jgi:hypothetical protein
VRNSSYLFSDDQALRAFCRSVEKIMQDGDPLQAEALIREKIARLPSKLGIFKQKCDSHTAASVMLPHWHALGDLMHNCTESGQQITAVTVDISWPGHYENHTESMNRYYEPVLEVQVYREADFFHPDTTRDAFSDMIRTRKARWIGSGYTNVREFQLEGLGVLYGELRRLETLPDKRALLPEEHDALWLGNALVAILIHQGVGIEIADKGLPFPVCVFVGSNESLPFYKALVVNLDEYHAVAGQWPFPLPSPQTRKPWQDGRTGAQWNADQQERAWEEKLLREALAKEKYKRRMAEKEEERRNPPKPPSLDDMFANAFDAAGMPDLNRTQGNEIFKLGFRALKAALSAMDDGSRRR